jgi:uncharacterized membrane protein YphA (DoxX/SURF4 family)
MKDFSFKFKSYEYLALDIMRIIVGALIIFKGGSFIANYDEFLKQVQTTVPFSDFFITYFVIGAHIIGGITMAVGIRARIGAILNIPVLCGAILFVHSKEGLFTPGQGMELAVMTLMGLFVVLWHGSGNLSLDAVFTYADKADKEQEEEHMKRAG